jgi:hypothetical protein
MAPVLTVGEAEDALFEAEWQAVRPVTEANVEAAP